MSGFRRLDLIESSIWSSRAPSLFPFSFPDAEMAVEQQLGFTLDLLNPKPTPFDLPLQCLLPYSPPSLLDFFDSAADLVTFPSAHSATAATAALRRFEEKAETELCLRALSERVTALELGLGRALGPKIEARDRKYKWTAEIKGPASDGFDRKYKMVTVAKAGEEKDFKWTAEIKGKGKDAPVAHTYTFQASTAPARGKAKSEEKEKGKEKEKKDKKKKGSDSATRVVEVEELNPGAIVIRKAFAKRVLDHTRGKRKELSPQDAALIIQMTFRAHLVRRSQVLRCLRDLAVAKAKLKEIRALFYNFSYRRRIANDAEERQRFTEKIIVLLTVDAIEGPDYMVRAARKSMVEELEAMLEAVDPQPPGKLGFMKRRKFDLPVGGPISKEMAMGVTGVVEMLNQEDSGSNGVPNGSA